MDGPLTLGKKTKNLKFSSSLPILLEFLLLSLIDLKCNEVILTVEFGAFNLCRTTTSTLFSF